MKSNRSPWGIIKNVNPVTEGIDFVTTEGHGGYRLSKTQNDKVDRRLRINSGFYEEDCEWSFIYVTFPELFPVSARTPAEATIARFYPAFLPIALEIISSH